MRYIFFGTPVFARIVLEKLVHAGSLPVALVCNPDKPTGRKQLLTPPPTKQYLQEHAPEVPVLQPDKISEEVVRGLEALGADVYVIAAYGKILPKELLAIPPKGTIGVHPSLLPLYRGTSPVQQAILDGATETGTSLFLADELLDHGPVIAEREFKLSGDETTPELAVKLAELSGDLLVETLPKYLAGELVPAPQDESCATFTKKIRTDDAFIAPEDLARAVREGGETARVIERKIRAFYPEPGAWTLEDGKRVKLLKGTLDKNGRLVIARLQEEGKLPRDLVKSPSG